MTTARATTETPADVGLRASIPVWLVALFIVTALALVAFPQIDLAASRLFTDASGGFPLQQDPVLLAINRGVTWAARVLALVLLLLSIAAWLPARARRLRAVAWAARHRRVILFLFVALALGPGLVVNTLVKDHSGRARPVNVTDFGGPAAFTRAFVPADQCERNCAFVSGHAAIAAFPFAGWFVAGSRRARRRWLIAGIAGGLTMGVCRMATGSHFLSDVLMAMFLVWLVTAVCAAVLLRAPSNRAAERVA